MMTWKMSWVLLSMVAMPAVADVFTGGLADPTRPAGSGGGVASVPTSGVSAIRISGGERLAVIDGRTYKLGDRYGEGRIANIRPFEVILERAGHQTSLRLMPKLEKDQRP